MPKYWAIADQHTVKVYRDGLAVDYRRGDYTGTRSETPAGMPYTPREGRGLPAGKLINTDEIDYTLEQMGYLASNSSHWKWVPDQGYYRFSVVPAGPAMSRAEADAWLEREQARQEARRKPGTPRIRAR